MSGSAPLPRPGEQIAGYTIEAELGRGGMGVVYRARDPRDGGSVALKLLLGDDPQGASAKRFTTEGWASVRLIHPNLVGVRGGGRDAYGRPYLVLEFVPGESLKARVARTGPLQPAVAARWARALASGLALAHAEDVLHRDLKPENVLLGPEDTPRLTDFGLARDLRAEERLTRTGDVMGTPAYMPPEQAAGEKARVDARADVYGLGATLYFMLTGQPPFSGPTAVNVLTSVLRDAPKPPRALAPGVPAALEAICLRCLEKEPEDRFPSMAALEAALDASLAVRRGPRAGPALAIVASGVGLAAWIVASASSPTAPEAAPPVHAEAPPPPTRSPAAVEVAGEEEAAADRPGDPGTLPDAGDADADGGAAGWDRLGPDARRWDAAALLAEPRLEVLDAWGARLESDGLRLICGGADAPRVSWPLTYDGGDAAFEVEVRLHTLEAQGERGAQVGIDLQRLDALGEATPVLWFETRARELSAPDGRTTLTALRWDGGERIGAQPVQALGTELLRWGPNAHLSLRVAYQAASRQWTLEAVLDERVVASAAWQAAAVFEPGDYRLGVGLNPFRGCDRDRFADATLTDLRASGWTPSVTGPDPTPLGRCGRLAASHALDELASVVAAWDSAEGDEAYERALALQGLVLARQGRDAAIPIFAELGRRALAGPGHWFPRWTSWVSCALDTTQVEVMTRAIQGIWGLTPQQSLRRALRLARDGDDSDRDWPGVAWAFRIADVARLDQAGELDRGRALLHSGRFGEALEVLRAIEAEAPGGSQGLAGFAAYRARDEAAARALWSADPQLGDRAGGYYAALLRGLDVENGE